MVGEILQTPVTVYIQTLKIQKRPDLKFKCRRPIYLDVNILPPYYYYL